MKVNSNTISDFLQIREFANNAFFGDENSSKMLVTQYTCSVANRYKSGDAGPTFCFMFSLTIVDTESATEQDIENNKKVQNEIESLSFLYSIKDIISFVNLIDTTKELKDSQEMSLIYIGSESSSTSQFNGGRPEFGISIIVEAVSAEAYDGIQRKPVNLEELKNTIKIKQNAQS